MQTAEFDKFADEYLATHARNIRISGEDPEYFARYKLVELRRLWTERRWPEPGAMLDFGSGIGASLPHLASAFPTAALTAFDVSERSLAVSRGRFDAISDHVLGDDVDALGDRRFDLIFTSCVFHHIDAALHVGILRKLKARLAPGGALVIFEHNPQNPVTRYIVATCAFDENAVLIAPKLLRERQRAAGFGRIETRYTGFFPHALAALRRLEPGLARVPFGAQYYTVARA